MADDNSEDVRLVRIHDLRRCLAVAFERLDLAPGDADGLAGLLIDSELRGHVDHGVAAFGILAGFYSGGTLNPRPQVRVLHETDGAILLDGDRGCGPAAPTRAMRWCIEHARAGKTIAVGAIRDWQLVVAGPFVRLAAEAGQIGLACTNFVPLVAPPGGRTAVFGTNPFAYALPSGHHPPVVLDVATTVTSMQKVRLAAERGAPMPTGVILDRTGSPTTDPADFLQGGFLASLGSPVAPHKGFGLALLVDALSGVLTGARFAGDVQPGPAGIFLCAIDVEAFLRREDFLARMDAQVDQVRHGDRGEGVDELVVPGERGERRHRDLSRRGVVPLAAPTWQILAARCESLAVPLPALLGEEGASQP